MGSLGPQYSVEIDRIGKAEWSELLQNFDDATVYQTWSYGAVRWSEDRLSHLVLKKGMEIIGLAQLTIMKFPVLGVGIAYIPWGPVWQKQGSGRDVNNLRYMIRALREEFVVRRGLFLRILPNEFQTDVNGIRTTFEEEGFQWKPYAYRTILLDLTPSLGDLRKGLSQHWRRHLNRAEKNNLEIIEGDSDELYQTFLHLLKGLLARKQFVPGVDYDKFREIQKDLPNPLKMKIMICRYEGEPASVMINSAVGNTGIYLFGATGNKGLKLSGSYLLFWRTIEWLKLNGYRCFDLCGVNSQKNPGVYRFKAGLSKNEVCHIGQFDACERTVSLILVIWGDKVRLTWKRMRFFLNRIQNWFREVFMFQKAGSKKNY